MPPAKVGHGILSRGRDALRHEGQAQAAALKLFIGRNASSSALAEKLHIAQKGL